MAAVWLIFLFYPVLALLESDAGLGWVVLGWVGTVGFAAVYVLSFQLGMGPARCRGSKQRGSWMLVGMVVSMAITLPAIGADAMTFFPFVVTILAYQFKPWMFALGSALCLGTMAVYMILAPDRWDYLALGFVVTILVLVHSVTTWLIRRSSEADRLEIALATSEEREAVARDVHDLLGHSLTVVKLKAQLARRLVDADPARAKAELEDIERITGEAIAGVRATVTGLRSVDFAPQLAASRSALAAAGIELEVHGSAKALSSAQSLPAGWILREATTNVLRHARASRVVVTVRPGEVIVEDDGVGLGACPDGPGSPGAPGEAPGNGLRGMRERASAAGAECRFEDSDLGGAKVELRW